ncbi:MAG: NERD domain-containing protein [Salinibacterium sp.]|nr:NERD domain-containing protein [Salinibacterium sp.]
MSDDRAPRQRVPGQSAMSNVVQAQAGRAPRGAMARLIGVSPLAAAARSHYRDALAELEVGDTLTTLGARWDVLHDVPVGRNGLDHLVIGPTGVYAVQTVMARGLDVVVSEDSVTVGGEAAESASIVRENAHDVAEALGTARGAQLTVKPVLVIVGPRRFTVAAAPEEVSVVQSAILGSTIVSAAQALSGHEVAGLSDLAELSSTWPVKSAVRQDLTQLFGEFDAIRGEVSAAYRRRVVLIAVSVVAAYLAMVIALAQLSWLVSSG